VKIKPIPINASNIFLLDEIINSFRKSEFFSYFGSRNPQDALKSHILTAVFVGCNQENVCGYCHIDYDGELNWLGIAVMPVYQGKGLGKKIIRYALDHAKELSVELYLSVHINNHKAIRLYENSGFRPVRMHGNAKIIMHKHKE
jgi:ribosomal protein S18 acetylase RimI-like enzyme